LWDHHRRNYNPKHDTPEETDLKPTKKNVISVNVVKTDSTGKKRKVKGT
jgi:hypothetical protein